jgi:hypothetical protein
VTSFSAATIASVPAQDRADVGLAQAERVGHDRRGERAGEPRRSSACPRARRRRSAVDLVGDDLG